MKERDLTESECLEKLEPAMKALVKIRTKRFYRQEFRTFEEYVRTRWGDQMLKIFEVWEAAVRERN